MGCRNRPQGIFKLPKKGTGSTAIELRQDYGSERITQKGKYMVPKTFNFIYKNYFQRKEWKSHEY